MSFIIHYTYDDDINWRGKEENEFQKVKPRFYKTLYKTNHFINKRYKSRKIQSKTNNGTLIKYQTIQY